MNWKDLKISIKLSIGFGSLIILLILISTLSIFGFAKTKKVNQELVQKKNSEIFLVEKEIDHLNWVSKLSDLFLKDEVTTVEVETDHTKCGLGKWLYSEETEILMQKDQKFAQLLNNPHVLADTTKHETLANLRKWS